MKKFLIPILFLIFLVPIASAVTVSDNFERSSVGSNWWVEGSVSIQQGDLATSGFGTLTWVGPAHLNADQWSQAKLSNQFPDNMGAQVFVRRGNNGRYGFHYDANGTPEDLRPQWDIKYDGVQTSRTRILAANFNIGAPQPGDTIKISAVGNKIDGFLNGQLIISANDNTLTDGHAGMAMTDALSGPGKVFADWEGGSN